MSDATRPADSGRVHPFPVQRYKVTTVSVWLDHHFVYAGSPEEALEKVKAGDVEAAYGVLENQFPTVAEQSAEYAPTIEDVLEGRAG